MKIEIFTDFVCPFCYIGKTQLKRAIKEAGYEEEVELIYRAYQLHPETPKEHAPRYLQALKDKFNGDVTKMNEVMDSIQYRAQEVGLTYQFEKMTTANTETAHRIVKWAAAYDKDIVLFDRLIQGYFTEGLDLNDEAQVLAIVDEVGLDVLQAKQVYHSQDYMQALDEDRYAAMQIGVNSVPFFVFENRYGIKGAEPDEVFIRTLHQTANYVEKQKEFTITAQGTSCDIDGNCS
ncbi:DSBA oxidoreductase [Lysinibacillus alkalisoli]|uniref:DSBA oxidoreductase n=1 Tax=Lysinibacillus alkalisoli TaxID=1911548 RepID=A0A917LHY8_9BACI|nr:DsbA family oxidoreductase [Lysinibacillus alkalisoli]GGG25201.1 DSBA oxidoreductase [Lysinibacillus alkalisoli]